MIRFGSVVAALAATVLAAGTVGSLAPQALARECHDPACLQLHLRGPRPVERGANATLTFTVSLRKPVAVGHFDAAVKNGLGVAADSAVVDGESARGAHYSATRVRIDVTASGTPLAAGTHTIAFDVHIARSIGAFGAIEASFGYRVQPGGQGFGETLLTDVPVSGDDYGIALQVPDGAPLLAQPHSWISVPATIEGASAMGPATLDIALPAGISDGVRVYRLAGERLGDRLSCRAPKPRLAACDVPTNPGTDTAVEIFLPTARHSRPGTTGTVEFDIVPALQQDPQPKNNFADAQVQFVSVTDVSFAFSHKHVAVAKGSTVDLALTVHNNAVTTTPQLSGQFTFTPSLDEANPPFAVRISGPGLFGGGGSQPFHVGPLRPGASAVYRVAVEPLQIGTSLELAVSDDTFSPRPACFDTRCGPAASVTVVPSAPTTSPGGPPLADTGVPTSAQLTMSGALLVMGLVFAFAGRRRRSG